MDLTSIQLALKAGQFILSAAKFFKQERLEDLKSELDSLKDKDLKSAITFVDLAQMSSTEDEANNNLCLAYEHFVKASNMYTATNLMADIVIASNGMIRETINDALGDNILSRKLTGVNDFRQAISSIEKEEEKLRQAFRGVSFCALSKNEYRISMLYIDKCLFKDVKGLTLLNNLQEKLASFSKAVDTVLKHLYVAVYISIRKEILELEELSQETSIDLLEVCPNYSQIMSLPSSIKYSGLLQKDERLATLAHMELY